MGEKKKPAKMWEAWFKCGCTLISEDANKHDYCGIHGDDREGVATYSPLVEPEASK